MPEIMDLRERIYLGFVSVMNLLFGAVASRISGWQGSKVKEIGAKILITSLSTALPMRVFSCLHLQKVPPPHNSPLAVKILTCELLVVRLRPKLWPIDTVNYILYVFLCVIK